MCGLVACPDPSIDLGPALTAIRHRGPDAAGFMTRAGVSLAHVRLAIQDPDPRSDQPFTAGPVTISYVGELFNAAHLRTLVEEARPGWAWRTTGDTEVLATALAVLGPARTLRQADGMFAVAWADETTPGVLHLARDRHGEIPLHVHQQKPLMAASELKAFAAAGRRSGPWVCDVGPGEWWQVDRNSHIDLTAYAVLGARARPQVTPEESPAELAAALALAVDRRVISDVPVCSLLSGGIDSAAIAAELVRHHADLTCYTAVLDPKSRDLRCAREVADWLGVKLVEVPVPVPSADDLAATVGHVELDSKAQVEIAWPCLHLAAQMRRDGFAVTYSGEGSDELWASYGFSYHGVKDKGWYAYRRDLIGSQARRNFPRVNKAFMAHGVEARLPFLDPGVVGLALSLSREAVQDGPGKPKAILSRAYAGRLPASVLGRAKVAFQDGMGLKQAIAGTIASPARFYKAELRRQFG